jgi:signal transduction histidine kinase
MQQKNFFLSITHELKTPIAATKLQLQTLQRSGLDEETKTQLIKSALLENERLNKLINNVLFASRFESDQFVIRPEKLQLAGFVENLLQRYFAKEIEDKTLLFVTQSNVEVKIDSLSFQSVITNLIENAFKYSAKSSEVRLRIFDEAGMAVIEIADKGIGIKDEDKEKVFEKFYRVGDEETRSSKGSGLGLYIVKFLVEQHQGKINLRNNAPKGSIFEIRIPLA